jgi:hypothetical protein
MLSKTYLLNQYENSILKLCVLKNKKFFLYENDQYLEIPFYIKVKKKNTLLLFSVDQSDFAPKLYLFFSFFNIFLKRKFQKFFYKKLVLKGLGFKIWHLNTENLLRFKLGFSHFIDILIPHEDIKVVLKKNALCIGSIDKSIAGNFCKKIKELKRPNLYNGKGFWYKNETKALKIFKKQ